MSHSRAGSRHAKHWNLETQTVFLNHGSFGACPREVLEQQAAYRRQMEANPVRFLQSERVPLWNDSRQAMAQLLHADPADVLFTRNVSEAISAVLLSLDLSNGDEILVTDHAYNACHCAVDAVCQRTGATLVLVRIPLTEISDDTIVEAVLAATTPRTRFALLDHVTSMTAMVLPITRLVAELKALDVQTIVDGAHAIGMLDVKVDEIGAAYYGGNCHKWLCAPKGIGFLHVGTSQRERLLPTTVSHGFNTNWEHVTRLQAMFDWVGTDDPTACLCLPSSINFMKRLEPGGLPALFSRNHNLAVEAQRILCDAVGTDSLYPETMLGSMAAIELPHTGPIPPEAKAGRADPLHYRLRDEFGIEVPVYWWPGPAIDENKPRRLLRVSAAAYNDVEQVHCLADVLREHSAATS